MIHYGNVREEEGLKVCQRRGRGVHISLAFDLMSVTIEKASVPLTHTKTVSQTVCNLQLGADLCG